MKRIPPKQSGSFARPASIGPLPHTLLDPEDGIEVCLIAKDPGDELRTKLTEVPVAGLTRVLAVGKLKKDYRDFSRRRELVSQFDMFLCDDRVLNFMPQLTGKAFYEKRKAPIPVRVSSNNAAAIAAEIVRARDSTHTLLGAGQTVSLKIGHSLMTPDQITENVLYSASRLVNLLPKKWRGVMSVHLLATGTVALPLYKNLPRIEADAADEDDEDDDDEDEDDEEEEMEEKKKKLTIDDDKKVVSKETKKVVPIIATANKAVKPVTTQSKPTTVGATLKKKDAEVLPPALPSSKGPSEQSSTKGSTLGATKPIVAAKSAATSAVVGVKRSLATATEGEENSRIVKKAKSATTATSTSSSTTTDAAAKVSTTKSAVLPIASITTQKAKGGSTIISKEVSKEVSKPATTVSTTASATATTTSATASSKVLPMKPSASIASVPPVLKRMPPQPELGVLRTEHKRIAEKAALKKATKETKGKF